MAKTVVCIGTGPSLTLDQIETARQKGFALYGCNNVYDIVPDLALLYACNLGWWDTYWPRVRFHPAEMWTTSFCAASTYPINHIRERAGMGLCTEPAVIHHGHGSGFSLVSMAHKKGFERILLLGYDLKYAPDYDGKAKRVGSSPRHFFDEYPPHLRHWPSKRISGGVHTELVELYRSVHDQGLVEIVNCSPDSALQGVIPTMDISDG